VLDNFSPHLSTRLDPRVGDWARNHNVELACTPTNSSSLNRIEAQFQGLRYYTLNGTDHASYGEQAHMIRRYLGWHNRNADDEKSREIVDRAKVPELNWLAIHFTARRLAPLDSGASLACPCTRPFRCESSRQLGVRPRRRRRLGPLRSLQPVATPSLPAFGPPHTRQRVRAGRLPQVGRGWAGSEMDSQPELKRVLDPPNIHLQAGRHYRPRSPGMPVLQDLHHIDH
jgi:hypothetical protein